jgi:exoribonuclease R
MTRIRPSEDPRSVAEVEHGVVPEDVFDRALAAIRAELDLPGEFPPDVLAEAERVVGEPDLPDADLTDLPFVTIDPPGSTDLDQALLITRRGRGYRVHYAIADLPAFVPPGCAIDQEARRRGQTLYAPDGRVPLHPRAISEAAASLLPGQDVPAFVWTFDLDPDGQTQEVRVERALVRNRVQLDYDEVQQAVDGGDGAEVLLLLREVGERRIALERARGGAALAIPDQEVIHHPDGYELRLRPPVPSEDWNAQISLMTGMGAAQIMLEGKVGVLRTMPEPDERDVARLRRQARALDHPWPRDMGYGEFLRDLDPQNPSDLALLHSSTRLFRGAGYTPFDGELPEGTVQAAVAAPYAHVTAPLRRLVDRFGLVICAELCAGREVPDWVREALPDLPELMSTSTRTARALERATTDAAEAAVLEGRVGEQFDAVVVDVDRRFDDGMVQVTAPPVLARCDGDLTLGDEIRVELTTADPVRREVRFRSVT